MSCAAVPPAVAGEGKRLPPEIGPPRAAAREQRSWLPAPSSRGQQEPVAPSGRTVSVDPCLATSLVGRNPKLDGRKSASNTGSRTILAAVITTRSRTVGIPSGRVWPGRPGLGICTRRNGWGRYEPVRNSSARPSRKARTPSTPDPSMESIVIPSTPGAPLLVAHVHPRPPHHVAAGDLVEQSMESTLLGLAWHCEQHALEGSNGVQAIGPSDGPSRSPGTHQRSSLPSRAPVKQGPFAPDGLCCPGHRHYYDPLRLPLGCRPLHGATAYRPTRSVPRRDRAEEGLPSSQDNLLTVPRPIRRGSSAPAPRSQMRSMAFALFVRARHLLGRQRR